MTVLEAAGSGAGVESGRHQNDAKCLRQALETAREKIERDRQEIASLQNEIVTLRGVSVRFRASINRYKRCISQPSRAVSKGLLGRTWETMALRRTRRRVSWEARQIKQAGLFDHAWYLRRYPDVEEAGVDPLGHYLEFGAFEQRDPHPLFDPNWYRAMYPEIWNTWLTPLGHFVVAGAANCYDPHPLFHTEWYVAQNRDVAESGLNPVRHYMQHAGESGRNPNPMFDSAWYLRQNKDVREAGENPLAHYIRRGVAELRDPHPLFQTAWYLKRYEHVAASGLDALEHYLTVGVFEGCRTKPEEDILPPEYAKQLPNKKESAPPNGKPVAYAGFEVSPTDTRAWLLRLRTGPRPQPHFDGTVGVFIHLFYPELAEEIAASLRAIPFDYTAYISTTDHAKKQTIEAAFQKVGISPRIKVVRNRGWDIAPFVLSFADEIRRHDICLKLHGKASVHSEIGVRWRHYLVSGLLGDAQNVSDIVACFMAHPELGVLMLPHWKAVARRAPVIGANYGHMRALLQRVGLTLSADQKIDFPSGSMFWFRSAALAPLLDLRLTPEDFADCRPRNLDATIAHAIERCILMFSAVGGFKWAYHPKYSDRRLPLGMRNLRQENASATGAQTSPN
jgi:hypothetical protein